MSALLGPAWHESQFGDELGRGARILASVSGGKDSTAMALALIEAGLDFVPVFADVGWEAPETYAYVRDVLPVVLGRDVTWVRAVVEVPEKHLADVLAIEAMLGHESPYVRMSAPRRLVLADRQGGGVDADVTRWAPDGDAGARSWTRGLYALGTV